jgi:DNA-binding transcriptional LysR family regulator
MELRQLKHFVAVAEDGHFTRAANRCHISQSALSTSIRSRRLPEAVMAVPLDTQPLMFVCRPDHPLPGRPRVALKSLVAEDFVGPPKGSTGYEAVDGVFAATGQERRVPFEVNDVLTILEFVAHGLGVTLVQEYLATSRPDLRAIPLADSSMTWTLAAIMSRDRATPRASAFISLLTEAAASHGGHS